LAGTRYLAGIGLELGKRVLQGHTCMMYSGPMHSKDEETNLKSIATGENMKNEELRITMYRTLVYIQCPKILYTDFFY
jgi:hypothetical protein